MVVDGGTQQQSHKTHGSKYNKKSGPPLAAAVAGADEDADEQHKRQYNPKEMGNPGNFPPNPMRIQPRMGTFNPQTMIPSSSSSSQSVANQFFPVQGPQNLNCPIAMNQINNMNNSQPMPQNFPWNSMGPSNFFNQNLNSGFPNQIQDINQLFQLQMFNLNAQLVPRNLNIPQNAAFVTNTQPANLNIPQNVPFCGNIQPANLSLHQNVGFHMNVQPSNLNLPQSVGFVGNSQLGFVNSNGIVQNMGSLNASTGTPIATQQLLGSSSFVQGIGPVPPLQKRNNFQTQPSKLQGNQRNAIGNRGKSNGKPAHLKKFKPNPRQVASGNRIVKSQFQKMQNSKGNFSSPNMQIRTEKDNAGSRQFSVANSTAQAQLEEKRLFTLSYTDKEIQQWREERRKNYPSKATIEKKLMQKPEVCDEASQLRRQQLKQILAKQAELGCEVAEIPSYYLSDSDGQVHEKKKGGKALSKKGNFQNNFRKRRRANKNDCFSEKKDFVKHNSYDGYDQNDVVSKKKRSINGDLVSHYPTSERKPTLLQKLLSSDIKRDKHHLVQTFRFMAMNSFFEYWPKNKLKFPLVLIKEAECENEFTAGKYVEGKNSQFFGEIEQPTGNNDYDGDYNNSRRTEGLVVNFVQGTGVQDPEEEEGEIID